LEGESEMRTRCRFALLAWVAGAVLVAAQAALAVDTATYLSYFGPNYSFTGINETSACDPTDTVPCTDPWGDTEPLFGQPVGSGDSLLFLPNNFLAQAVGPADFDLTGSLLQTVITATALNATIDLLRIHEFGDVTFVGPAHVNTGSFAAMSGFLTITHALVGSVNTDILDVVIGFNAGGGPNGSFTPAALGTVGLTPLTHPGTTLWSGDVLIDVTTYVPDATRAILTLDNDLYAYSDGSPFASAKIQKKVTIEVVPEPGTFALLCGGLLALSLRGRSRRS